HGAFVVPTNSSACTPYRCPILPLYFYLKAPPPTELYTLSLHDALPICPHTEVADRRCRLHRWDDRDRAGPLRRPGREPAGDVRRSEEHTSELQSRSDLVCRLLLEKKK